jgi:hypothetical protein
MTRQEMTQMLKDHPRSNHQNNTTNRVQVQIIVQDYQNKNHEIEKKAPANAGTFFSFWPPV